MASKTAFNAKNLEALGVERLAGLLIEVGSGNVAVRRKIQLALAGAESPREVARIVAKRLTSIGRARTYVDWKDRKRLVADLDAQRRAIVEQVAPHEPGEALSLLWRFMGLAPPVFERCDDSDGIVGDTFARARADLGEIARTARPDPKALAGQVFAALQDNDYAQFDGLVTIVAPALGPEGLAELKALVEALGRAPVATPSKKDWRAVGWGSGGVIYAHEVEERQRQAAVAMALRDIADAQGDVDGYVARFDPKARKAPRIAADIAMRLLAAGRREDALGVIERAEIDGQRWIPIEYQDARLATLEALGRQDEAQAYRRECFERTLSVDKLRGFLSRLPVFEDVEAEERAMEFAAAHRGLASALVFFLEWPALRRAAGLLIDRRNELDGDLYEILGPAAETLSEHHPLAATVALRAMIDFTLNKARSTRYGHAARHLAECGALARRIADFGDIDTHDAFLARLKTEHGKKTGFWSRVQG